MICPSVAARTIFSASSGSSSSVTTLAWYRLPGLSPLSCSNASAVRTCTATEHNTSKSRVVSLQRDEDVNAIPG